MKLLLMGAGRVGQAIAEMLAGTGDYQLVVADSDEKALDAVAGLNVPVINMDATRPTDLEKAARDVDALISACPIHVNPAIAKAARAAGKHYFDLSEDMETTREIRALFEGADCACVPQCGVSPGFASIVTRDLTRYLAAPLDVSVRVGALPLYPTNRLKYNPTWSVDGLYSEYTQPCEAIRDGKPTTLDPLEGLEQFTLDGHEYEAFNTAGGFGALCESLAGQVRNLTFKTIRYPGHLNLVQFMMEDLGMRRRRDRFNMVLEGTLPLTQQDVLILFITVTGLKNRRPVQESYVRKIHHGTVMDRQDSAIQSASAAALCVMVDLLREGKLPAKGYVRQEDVALKDFLDNRFGECFR